MAELLIDLDALIRNYRKLAALAGTAQCGAAVKADGYGLGGDRVGAALYRAGCRHLFVAHMDEGIRLRPHVEDAKIYVLHGPHTEDVTPFHVHDLIPVLNSRQQIDFWNSHGLGRPAVLHIDSGMNRLGLDTDEAGEIIDHPGRMTFPVAMIMSHLACADEPEHELNPLQQARFSIRASAMRDALGGEIPLSLANSAGIFLGEKYHFDLVRPGIALYGGCPFVEGDNPMEPVITLRASILQARDVDPPGTAGYGGVYRITGPSRLLTIDMGYADGFLRAFGEGRWTPTIGGHPAPIVGRVSMDLTILNASNVPDELTQPGMMVDVIGGENTLDKAAEATGLISYELLTLLRHRYKRIYAESIG